MEYTIDYCFRQGTQPYEKMYLDEKEMKVWINEIKKSMKQENPYIFKHKGKEINLINTKHLDFIRIVTNLKREEKQNFNLKIKTKSKETIDVKIVFDGDKQKAMEIMLNSLAKKGEITEFKTIRNTIFVIKNDEIIYANIKN